MRRMMGCCILVLLICCLLGAERYARYNLAGYFPASIKRIVIMSDDDCNGKKWDIKDKGGKSVLTGNVGKSLCGSNDHTPFAFNFEIDISALNTIGTYSFVMEGVKSCSIDIKKDPYASMIQSHLRWFRVHRSGSKDVFDRQPAHFGDSSSYIYHRKGASNTDEWEENAAGKKINLQGGWYDAFVYSKFTLTTGLAVYSLLRAYEINPSIFVKNYSKTDLVDVLDEAKWGLDYLLKVMPDDNEFIIQLGGFGDNDRGALLPNEDPLEGKRECYSIFSSPQMGCAAAALALGSAVFAKAGKAEDAKKYKAAAVKIYKKAITKEALTPAWLERDYDLYKDDTPYDNLLQAAIELYLLTKEPNYLADAKKFANSAKNAYWISYQNVNMIAHLRAMKDVAESKKYFLEDMKDFANRASSSGNIWLAPLEYSFSHTYANIESAIAALLYQSATGEKTYEKMAMAMVDYVYGCNNWGLSFSSIPSIKKSVRHYYSQIYMLQEALFPEGGIVVGPLDAASHDEESKWCYFDPKAQSTYKFNTEKVKFFDNYDDYMCTTPHINGVAEGVLLCSILSATYGK